jgi:hypothetical protein
MNKFTIYDDLIPNFYQEDLKKEIFSSNFPWFYNPVNVSESDLTVAFDPTISYPEQFTHPVIWDGKAPDKDAFHFINPILLFFQKETGTVIDEILRIKLNLLVQKFEPTQNVPHCDHIRDDIKTLIYYVNDSDGDTVIYDEVWPEKEPKTIISRITPKQGRLILLDSNRWHASTNPTESKARSVININFK